MSVEDAAPGFQQRVRGDARREAGQLPLRWERKQEGSRGRDAGAGQSVFSARRAVVNGVEGGGDLLGEGVLRELLPLLAVARRLDGGQQREDAAVERGGQHAHAPK